MNLSSVTILSSLTGSMARGRARARRAFRPVSAQLLWVGALTGTLLAAGSARAASVIDVSPGADINTLTSSLQPGDVVRFADGTYTISSTLGWDGIGTAEQPITLKAVEGAHPEITIEGSANVAYISNAAYMTIDGLAFRGSEDPEKQGYSAIVVEKSDHVTLVNVAASRKNGFGVYAVENTNLTIEHSEFSELTSYHGIQIDASASRFSSGVSIRNNWIHNVTGSNAGGIVLSSYVFDSEVVNNVVHAIENRGIYLGQYTNGDANLVEGNVVFAVGQAGIEAHGTAIVRNNIIFNSNGYGISSTPGDKDTAYSIAIVNNTVVNTLNRAVFYKHQNSEAAVPFTLVNNALCSPLTYAFKSENVGESNYELLDVSNNVACGLVETYEGLLSGFIPGAGYTDYADASVWNFWPTDESMLVDAASTEPSELVPATDFNGLERDASPDVGAYERLYATNPGWVIVEGFKSLDITPPDSEEPVETGCKGCGGSQSSSASASPLMLVGLSALFMRHKRRK